MAPSANHQDEPPGLVFGQVVVDEPSDRSAIIDLPGEGSDSMPPRNLGKDDVHDDGTNAVDSGSVPDNASSGGAGSTTGEVAKVSLAAPQDATRRQCTPLQVGYCKQLPYNLTSFPNALGHANASEAVHDVDRFK